MLAMVRSSDKIKIGSMSLLLATCLNLLSLPVILGVPQSPAVEGSSSSLSQGTTSSSSATGLPLPLARMTSEPSAAESNDGDVTQSDKLTRASAASLNQPMSSISNGEEKEKVQAAFSTASGTNNNNEIAHGTGESSDSAPSLYGTTGLNGIGETSKVINGQKASSFVDFPPFTKPVSSGTRYQRQRRSYPISSLMSQEPPHLSRPDELEFNLGDDGDSEAFLKLMSILANEDENNNQGLYRPLVDDDDETSVDIGNFQRPVANPYWTPLLGRPSEPINVMSSLLAEPPRTSSHARGLYDLGERPSHTEFGMGPRAASLRDEDETDGEWLDNSVPLHGSLMKTRRSGPGGGLNANTEFTFNPVKSHFRRYMRAVPLKSGLGMEFMPGGGRFGAIVPPGRMSRRRRATAMSGFPVAMHWM